MKTEKTKRVDQGPNEYECQMCGTVSSFEQLNDIADLSCRIAPNEPVPAGECPECGALAHPVVEPSPDRLALLGRELQHELRVNGPRSLAGIIAELMLHDETADMAVEAQFRAIAEGR